jgi:hypothetical protein
MAPMRGRGFARIPWLFFAQCSQSTVLDPSLPASQKKARSYIRSRPGLARLEPRFAVAAAGMLPTNILKVDGSGTGMGVSGGSDGGSEDEIRGALVEASGLPGPGESSSKNCEVGGSMELGWMGGEVFG